MKKMMLCALCALCVMVANAQTKGDLHYVYGVDFSKVTVSGAKETEADFAQVFVKINMLLVSEPESYSFSRMLGKNVEVVLEPMLKKLEACDYTDMKRVTAVVPQLDENSMVEDYVLPQTEGYGVVLVAKLLDKMRDKAFYDLVVFDIATRKILIQQEVSGGAGGFGLRNFWAASVREVIQKTKLYKKQK